MKKEHKRMKLTRESTPGLRKRYVGGQLEIHTVDLGRVFRGQIKRVWVEGTGDETQLVVELAWMAKRAGGRWVETPSRPYRISLSLYAVVPLSEDRLELVSDVMVERAVLFPKGGSFNVLRRNQVQPAARPYP